MGRDEKRAYHGSDIRSLAGGIPNTSQNARLGAPLRACLPTSGSGRTRIFWLESVSSRTMALDVQPLMIDQRSVPAHSG